MLHVHYDSLPDDDVVVQTKELLESCKQELNKSDNDFETICVHHNADYVIQSVETQNNADAEYWEHLIGRSTDDMVVSMKRQFGGRVTVLEEEYKTGHISRLLQFSDGPEPVLVRGHWIGGQPGKGGSVIFSGRKLLDRRLQFIN